MGKWTKESHGFSILKPIADKILSCPEKKSRVWSDAYEAWGFYADETSHEDEFIFWSVLCIGDRVHLGSSLGHSCEADDIALVVDIEKDPTTSLRKAKLLLSTGRLVELRVEEGKIFKWAWRYVF
jgi:hypothetical protein